jgi:hypothetical protein
MTVPRILVVEDETIVALDIRQQLRARVRGRARQPR